MMADNEEPEFLLLGNDPALDLLNTTPVLASEPVDLLPDYAALARWLAAAGLATAREGRELRERWQNSAQGLRALAEVKALREALRGILVATASGAAVSASWLETVNAALGRAHVRQAIEWDARAWRFSLRLSRDQEGAATASVRVAESIAALLSGKDLSCVRKCENPSCVLWFYDTSKNHTRRWCSMDLCGNRAKVAAHYRRNAGRSRTLR